MTRLLTNLKFWLSAVIVLWIVAVTVIIHGMPQS
jgi:hypothetical protein